MIRSLAASAVALTAMGLLCTSSAHAQRYLCTDGDSGWIASADYLYWTVRSPGV